MSVDAGFAKLGLTPARIASQKSKALTQLRSDISEGSKGVDGALVLNVAVLCNIAVSDVYSECYCYDHNVPFLT